MKFGHFVKLDNAFMQLNDAYQETDTSFKDKDWENPKEIEEWNEEFNELIRKANDLRERLIYTFKLEEEEGEG